MSFSSRSCIILLIELMILHIQALLEETRQYYTLLATREYYSPSSSTLTSTASTSTQTPFTAPLLLPTPLLHLESSQTLATTIKELTHSLSSSASESTSLQAQLKADLSLLSDAERIRRGLIERKGKENARMVVEGGEGVIRRMEEKARREKEGREKVLQDLVWFLEALAGDEDVNECVYDDDVPEFVSVDFQPVKSFLSCYVLLEVLRRILD